MNRFFGLLSIILLLVISSTSYSQKQEILGAGATFPYPLYSKMFDEYNKKTGHKINYQSIGSGGGIKQLTSKTVDFGASDAFMDDKELSTAGGDILHIPTALGAVVVTYNIPSLKQSINLNAELIAKIYLGEIKNWNDKQIKSLNPKVTFPNLQIIAVGRSDGSGTTFIFTDYLTKANKQWETAKGKGKSVQWSAGVLAGKGNEGVAGMVKQTPGSIGYVELEYALKNKMSIGNIQNKAGKFIVPSIASVTKAANVNMPNDTRVTLTNTDAPEGYPIASFTWILIYKEQNYSNKAVEKAKTVLELLKWVINEGQVYHSALSYAPIPKAVQAKAMIILKSATFSGKPILK